MPETKLDSSDYSDMSGVDYKDHVRSDDTDIYSDAWKVETLTTDSPTGEKEFSWINTKWTTWHAYYRKNSQLASSIDKKALWTVGQGFKAKGSLYGRFKTRIKIGMGKDTLTSIFYNLDRVGQIGGDCYAEIVRDKSNRIVNLKPMNPDAMRIIVNEFGILKRYEQHSMLGNKKIVKVWKPEEIFHIPFNRIADEVHGISEIERQEVDIQARNESEKDLKVIFRRYVKPLMITEIDSDDTDKIATFKAKFDIAYEKGENMFVPKDIVSIERFSIPQGATLDPLPWVKHLQRKQVISDGVPQVILGESGTEDTEASTKIVYLSFEQYIKFRQQLWEENVKAQLGLDIKFNFPASIQPDLLSDTRKDGKLNKKPNVTPGKTE